MLVCDSCGECLYRKQQNIAKQIGDDDKQAAYLAEIRSIIDNRKEDDSAPYLVYLFGLKQREYGIPTGTYPKEKYNTIIMDMETEIEKKIEGAEDPLEMSLVFAQIGNYIDFGAMNEVKTEVLYQLLEEKFGDGLDSQVYGQFLADCEKGGKFVLLCDNCGEIVLDKLMLRQLRKRFPKLEITAMVRGKEVLNDATMEDAVFCGLDKEVTVIGNGNGAAGTVLKMLSDEARQVIEEADLILAKGQGNYESFSEYPGNVYYTFLCKCDLFTSRFQVPRLTGMFVKSGR